MLKFRKSFFALPLAIFMVSGLSACSSLGFGGADSDEPAYVEEPVETLYNAAAALMEDGKYGAAATAFDEVERQHPYSQWAARAELMSAYAHYKELKYDDAIIGLQSFIALHPGNERVDYAHYLLALCYYEQISDVGRDQGMTIAARDALEEVIRRFPESPYARDAGLKLDLTRDHLAGKEMAIGRFYQNSRHYNAAIGRFNTVIDEYQTTSQVPEALYRLVESYMALGLVDEAKRTAAVLGYNFPGNQWYEDSYILLGEDPEYQLNEEDRNWLRRGLDNSIDAIGGVF